MTLVPVFFGRFEHSLDTKGRVILPVKFRPHFEHGGYLTSYKDRCLALWTPEEFEKQMLEMRDQQATSDTHRQLARLWAQGSQEVEVDRKTGRMALPGYLRQFARLEGEVLVNGAIDRIELWNPAEFAAKVMTAEPDLTGDEPLVSVGAEVGS